MIEIALMTGTRRETRAGEAIRWIRQNKPKIVIGGCCKTGIDKEIEEYCAGKIHYIKVYAKWFMLGKKGGPKRNALMGSILKGLMLLWDLDIDDVVCAAFPDDKSTGTYNMIKWCSKRRVRIDRPPRTFH